MAKEGTRRSAFAIPPSPLYGWRGACWLAAAAAVVCYLNVLPNDFCDDGIPVVQRSEKVNAPDQWGAIWTTDYWSDAKLATPNRDLLYRPVALCSYRLIRLLSDGLDARRADGPHGGPYSSSGGLHGGTDSIARPLDPVGANRSALPHHVVNVLLHALISGLLVHFCRHLGMSRGCALAAGLVFAVLPIHTDVLNNVVGRADLLATLGILLTLLCHRHVVFAPSAAARLGWMAAAAVAALVALGSKENGLAVVALVPMFDAYWQGRSQEARGKRQEAGGNRKNVETSKRRNVGTTEQVNAEPSERSSAAASRSRGSARPWLRGVVASCLRVFVVISRTVYIAVPTACYLVLRYYALEGRLHQAPALTKTVNVLVDAPPWQHVLGVVQLWGMYWAKTLWPLVLSVNYSINAIHLATGLLHPYVLLGVVVAAVLAFASVWAWRRGNRSVAIVALTLLISYLPTANALVLIQVFFAERIWYLPSLWVAVLAGMAVRRVPARSVWGAAGVIVLLGMAARCWIRNSEWRDNGTLYAAAFRDMPDSITARHHYGRWLALESGDPATLPAGIALLRSAIEMDPGFTDSQRVLGHAYARAGNRAKAVEHLQIADMHVPGHPPTVELLEELCAQLMQENAAELERLRVAAAAAPGDAGAEVALVRKLRELCRAQEAIDRFREREGAFANNLAWQSEYAVTLVYLNRRDEAIERYRECLALAAGGGPHGGPYEATDDGAHDGSFGRSDEVQLALELAMLLLERREGADLKEARQLAERAAALSPGHPSVLMCRAELLALGGELTEALALYDRAIRALPEGSEQRRMLEHRAEALGRQPKRP